MTLTLVAPFRADHVSSFLRPPERVTAPDDYARGRIDADELRGGFSSTVEGNALTYDEEVAKLRLVVEVAEEIWG